MPSTSEPDKRLHTALQQQGSAAGPVPKPTCGYTPRAAGASEAGVRRRLTQGRREIAGFRKEETVGVKFLSPEWCKAVQDALNSNDAFKSAAGSQAAKVQQVVTGPDGEHRYWFKLEGGAATLGDGE